MKRAHLKSPSAVFPGQFVRVTPGSHSLERGLAILRAFRQGNSVLTNGEIAERTALPKPTVSRLTHSLVIAGFLLFDADQRAYRLAPVCLNMALVYMDELPLMRTAVPLMREVAQREAVNVGLAAPDLCDMVYLTSVRFSRGGLSRRVMSGSRRPIETVSLGLSYLDALEDSARSRLLLDILKNCRSTEDLVHARVSRAHDQILSLGYCIADWHVGVIAIATALKISSRAIYSLNISFPSLDPAQTGQQLDRCGATLLHLATAIRAVWSEQSTKVRA